jgi:hypothetical protein
MTSKLVASVFTAVFPTDNPAGKDHSLVLFIVVSDPVRIAFGNEFVELRMEYPKKSLLVEHVVAGVLVGAV